MQLAMLESMFDDQRWASLLPLTIVSDDLERYIVPRRRWQIHGTQLNTLVLPTF